MFKYREYKKHTVKDEIESLLRKNSETYEDIEATSKNFNPNEEFDNFCEPFYAWTKENVVFTVSSGDGGDIFITCVPRNPSEEKPECL